VPMLKRIICICLLVALIGSNFSRFFIYAGFELNHKYIAENLCVNKSRPWLHCNGKCYFMRKIKEAQDNEKKQERADQKAHYQEALPVIQSTSTLAFEEQSPENSYHQAITPKTIQRTYPILQPPNLV